MARTLLAASVFAMAAVSLVGVGYSLDQLTNGVRDIHEHWWSTAPVVMLAISVAGRIALRARAAE
jgi:hypothetical protein